MIMIGDIKANETIGVFICTLNHSTSLNHSTTGWGVHLRVESFNDIEIVVESFNDVELFNNGFNVVESFNNEFNVVE